jgi:hypothetical protein
MTTAPHEHLARLRNRFVEGLPDRLLAIEEAMARATAGAPLEDSERQFHKLAGTAGTYGVEPVASIAAIGELLCSDPSVSQQERLATLEIIIQKLRDEVDRCMHG